MIRPHHIAEARTDSVSHVYDDLILLTSTMTGDEKHAEAASSTLDVLWILHGRVLRIDSLDPKTDFLSYSISTVSIMNDSISIAKVRRGPIRRHDSRVQRFSRNYSLLMRLDGLAVDDNAAGPLVEEVCWHTGVEAPRLKFHKGRSRYTGATEQPRSLWVNSFGEADVQQRERTTGRRIPPFGAIRLGRQSTLMTIAHELGHHFVFALEPPNTPAHGKIWIGRFDEAAAAIATHLDLL